MSKQDKEAFDKWNENSTTTREEIKKQLQNSPFKTTFKATMGFYLAQTVATFMGLAIIGGVILIGFLILSSFFRRIL